MSLGIANPNAWIYFAGLQGLMVGVPVGFSAVFLRQLNYNGMHIIIGVPIACFLGLMTGLYTESKVLKKTNSFPTAIGGAILAVGATSTITLISFSKLLSFVRLIKETF